MSLFDDNMILYVENLEDATKKQFVVVNSSKASWIQNQHKKSAAFLHTNKPSEKEIKKSIQFIIGIKR